MFQDNDCSEEMAFASPLVANGISGKTNYVQLLDEFDSSGEHKFSSYTLHVRSVCLLVYNKTLSTEPWQPQHCHLLHEVMTKLLADRALCVLYAF